MQLDSTFNGGVTKAKYNFQIIADGTEHETVCGRKFSLRAVTFRDKRDHLKGPDAYNDFMASELPDFDCYDDMNEFKAECDSRKEKRKQWESDIADILGMQDPEISHTGSEFFTALEIKVVDDNAESAAD